MRFDEFQSLVERLAREVPPQFREGIVSVEVSPKTVPHPVRGDVYTLGECVPLDWSGSGADLQSRIVLYHGSFGALARLGAFDWRREAWETLTHELRHHLEWRADVDALEAYDWAAEQNFARHEGQPFDPLFFRSGERLDGGAWKVDDDVFIERSAEGGKQVELVWHGRRYRVPIPGVAPPAPLFLTLDGLADPPPGDAVLVVTPKVRLRELLRRRRAPVRLAVPVTPLDA